MHMMVQTLCNLHTMVQKHIIHIVQQKHSVIHTLCNRDTL